MTEEQKSPILIDCTKYEEDVEKLRVLDAKLNLEYTTRPYREASEEKRQLGLDASHAHEEYLNARESLAEIEHWNEVEQGRFVREREFRDVQAAMRKSGDRNSRNNDAIGWLVEHKEEIKALIEQNKVQGGL
jgi:hypothetical protein